MTVDLRDTIAPKSDQMNADDLIGGPRTIRITRVSANPESPEQPVSIYFEGDNGKPYKPCKSMRRVLVQVWGPDASTFPGRAMTLYRDPGVQFGGLQVGGIRISHMSNIDKPMTMALTATKAARKPFTVQPLKEERPAPKVDVPALLRAQATKGKDAFTAWFNSADGKAIRGGHGALVQELLPELRDIAAQADKAAADTEADPFTTGPSEADLARAEAEARQAAETAAQDAA